MLVEAIQADPALTSRLLRHVNASLSAQEASACTVAEAVFRLGLRTLYNLALGFSVLPSHHPGKCQQFEYWDYWSRSLARAISARCLAIHGPVIPQEAYTCALLIGVGRLAFATSHPEEYGRVLSQAAEGIGDQVELEKKAFALSHCDLAALMFRDWRLPDSFVRAALHFEIFDPLERDGENGELGAILWGASILAEELCSRDESRASSRRLASVRKRLGLNAKDFEAVRLKASAEWQQAAKILTSQSDGEGLLGGERRELDPAFFLSLAEPVPGEAGNLKRGKQLSILAVDDDRGALKKLEVLLNREGHKVITAPDGKEALDLALQVKPDLILTDWMMPNMDGVELVRALRLTEIGRQIMVLVLTGRDEEDHIVEAFDAGANDYVVKSKMTKILMARVRACQRMIELREEVEKSKAEQIQEMRRSNERLSKAALMDALTDLHNRRAATEALEQEVSYARRARKPLSVIMMDLDHFKDINDKYGHGVGDEVLRKTAEVLRSSTRKGDLVCRLGGEEFLVICRGSDLESAAVSAGRLRDAIEKNEIRSGAFSGHVTGSLGVAELAETDQTMDGLLKVADDRVYIAKDRGRNQVCTSEEDEPRALSA